MKALPSPAEPILEARFVDEIPGCDLEPRVDAVGPAKPRLNWYERLTWYVLIFASPPMAVYVGWGIIEYGR